MMTLRRFDTLFLRLFVLMWVTLVASHVVAYVLAVPAMEPAGPGAGPAADRLAWSRWPTLPSLPPGNPFATAGDPPAAGLSPGAAPPPPNHNMHAGPPPPPLIGGPPSAQSVPPALPPHVLWADYALRMLVIGLGALLGARWLSAPMRRLSAAAGTLGQGLGPGQPPQLDDRRGTQEVRETARVFNHMAIRLQEQFDARGLHMAALSHDLRTPLTRLRMRLEALPEAAAQAAVADILEMNAMIEGTLAVLREQQDDSGARVVDVAAMLQALVDDLAEQGQVVAMDGVDGAPALHAKAHPAALKRILDNLVGNALRYGGSASLGVVATDARVMVHVDDNGPGIPPGQMEQAFQPWVRLTTTHARAGHGLGLAVARDLAERDGAQLTLHNRPGGGLRAQLALPRA
ncbi:HAMP domain-containing protein [Polaromonas sp. P1-6]|nr:HAMP domain-containing protein [Polaromonas sp. P1-6]